MALKSKKVDLWIIDPQNDFMDNTDSSLPVPGANDDMKRAAKFISRIGRKLNDIHVTLDSHRPIDVGHPGMWRDENGDMPKPFTLISDKDIEVSRWAPRNPHFRLKLLNYARELKAGGKYQIMVWPEHCLIGSQGHNVQAELFGELAEWERVSFANVDYITKGTNAFTEHYGAFMAEVPDPDDPSTTLNTNAIKSLSDADIVVILGEASSHCVMATINQAIANLSPDQVKKFVVLTDCMSPVPKVGSGPNFPEIASIWLRGIEKLGVTLTKSVDFLN